MLYALVEIGTNKALRCLQKRQGWGSGEAINAGYGEEQ